MRLPIGILLAVMLVACQTGAPAVPKKTVAKTVVASTEPVVSTEAGASTVAVAPSVGPAAQVTATPLVVAATPGPAGKLLKPASGVATLSGTIQVDASYLVSAGGGNIISAGGGNLVAAGGGNLVSAGAGNLVSAGGGNVMVGGQLVASGGGNMVSTNGGNFVSHNSAAIVSAGGGNLVSAGGGNFQLLSDQAATSTVAAATSQTLPIGTVLPAVGMQVRVVTLTPPRRVLPLGTDAQGKPVYVVYSNAQGNYEVYIPASEQGNVMVQAIDPATSDPKTQYDLFTPTSGTGEDVDEDTALGTDYLVRSFAERFDQILAKDIDENSDILTKDWATSDHTLDGAKALIGTTVGRLNRLAKASGLVDEPDPARRHAVCERVALASCAVLLPLDAIPANLGSNPPAGGALHTIVTLLKKYRLLAGSHMASAPTFFDNKPYILAANQCKIDLADRIAIRKPSEFCDFWVREYFGADDKDAFVNIRETMADLDPCGPFFQDAGVLEDAAVSLTLALILRLQEQMDLPPVKPGGAETAIDIIRNYDPKSSLPDAKALPPTCQGVDFYASPCPTLH